AVAYQVQDVATSAMTGGAVASSDGNGYYSGFYDPNYDPAWRCFSCGWGYPEGGFNLALGSYYDPFYYDSFYDSYYGGFGFGNIFYPTYPIYVTRPIGIGRGIGHGVRPRPRPIGVGVSGRLGGGGIARPSASVVPSTAARPRPGGVAVGRPAVAAVRPGTVGPAGAVRARPRGNEEVIIRRSGTPAPAINRGNEGRPVFREPRPSQGGVAQPAGRSGEPTREYRPAYREPPQAQRPANNPPPRNNPPEQHNSPPPRSAPPPASRGGGGGGGRPRGH
ncbi:MAG TPA: hypothetical protein VHW65_05385, partial [Gemmatimonadales bacterium]|nr:hypothetical protein [Gemmatimonadales bacterium]